MSDNQSLESGGRLPKPVLMLLAMSVFVVAASGLLWLTVGRREARESAWWSTWEMLNVGAEHNLATWWAVAQWVLLAAVAAGVGVLVSRYRWWWFGVALVAAYASLDEATEIHEELYVLGESLGRWLPYDFFSYRWVLAGLLAVGLVALSLGPLVRRLPRDVAVRLVAAACVFLTGALGLETVAGHVESRLQALTWHMIALIHAEELMELVGVGLAIWAVQSMCQWQRTERGLLVAARDYSG